MQPDERERALAAFERRKSGDTSYRKDLKIPPEVYLIAELGYYYGWGAIEAAKRGYVESFEIVNKDGERVEKRQISSELASERNDLLTAIKIDENNSVEIMRIAKHYFLDLGGNSYASKPFAGWATRHQIDISDLYTSHNDLKFYMDNPELCYDAYHKTIK